MDCGTYADHSMLIEQYQQLRGRTILVTGATGFVGGALARHLHAQQIKVLATGRNAQKAQALQALGIATQIGDLTDTAFVQSLVRACDIVIHCAAKSEPWGALHAFEAANQIATQVIVSACERANVQRLVHISTPSLYFCLDSRTAVKETDPLPDAFPNHYVRTKRQAEAVVQAANVDAITLRPRAIYGPGDQALLPRLIDRMRSGRLPKIGAGQNMADLTYIENLIAAIVLAATVTQPAQRVFNVTDGTPVNLWDVLAQLAQTLELPPLQRQFSYHTALRIAGVLEAAWRIGRLSGEPPLTKYSVSVLGLTQTLEISAARQTLGYQPQFTTQQGLARTLQAYQDD